MAGTEHQQWGWLVCLVLLQCTVFEPNVPPTPDVAPPVPDIPTITFPDCQTYCSSVQTACTGANAQYESVDECLQVCSSGAGIPAGTTGDTSTNTVGCRITYAKAALDDPDSNCLYAGVSGGNQCGSWCDVLCHLKQHNCAGSVQNIGTCLVECKVLSTDGTLGDLDGDTVQCRIEHSRLAGLDENNQDLHCPSTDAVNGVFCSDAKPSCERYCHVVQSACGTTDTQTLGFSPHAQYPTNVACENVCTTLWGPDDDEAIECRGKQAKLAALTPAESCPLAGPISKDACGSECDSVCQLISAFCPSDNVLDSMCQNGCESYEAALPCQSALLSKAIAGSGTMDETTCAQMNPTTSPTCSDYNCPAYCDAIQDTCNTTETAQYSNLPTCLSYCLEWAQWSPGGTTPNGKNNLSCRMAQLNNTEIVLDEQCANAGPYGGATCGSWCDNLCTIVDAQCVDDRKPNFASFSSCHDACATYSPKGQIGDTTGGTVQCRLTLLGPSTMLGTSSVADGCAIAGVSGNEVCSDPDPVPDPPPGP